jgi:predicted acetyltransferase
MTSDLSSLLRVRANSSIVVAMPVVPAGSVSAVSIDIRIVKDSEHQQWLDHLARAFFEHSAKGASEYYLSNSDPNRSRGAFDGDAVVGTLRSFATELTVPGPATIPASALTAVSVAATHRRRGVLTSMIEADLRESADRGEAVSILLASEYPIYGRFGYGPATERVKYEVSTTDLRFLRKSEGAVEFVDMARLRSLAPPVYERFRTWMPGSISRRDDWWDRVTRQVDVPGADPWKGFQAVYRSPSGDVEGYVLYEGKPDWVAPAGNGALTIDELLATTPGAYQALWEFCINIDLLTSTVAQNRATDELLPYLVNDARKVRTIARDDFLWVRILDTCAALAGRQYSSGGRLILDVRDDHALAAGRFALEASSTGVSCTPTNDAPDLTIPVHALGSAYLGGVAMSRLYAAGLIDEHHAGSVSLGDSMFMTSRAPWCTTYF